MRRFFLLHPDSGPVTNFRRLARQVAFSGLLGLVGAVARADAPPPQTPSLADVDVDGIPDEFELFFRTGTSTETPDSDGDGFLDGREIAQQSNPLDPSSVPDPLDRALALRITLLPIDTNSFGVLFIGWSLREFEFPSALRIRFCKGENAEDVTREYVRAGQLLHSEDQHVVTLAVILDRSAAQGRTQIDASLTLDGIDVRTDLMFGTTVGTIYQGKLTKSQVTPSTYIVEYEYLPDTYDGFPAATDPGDDDKIFQETLYVFPSGRYVVVGNNCDNRPNEHCPSFLNTVGQTGRVRRR